MPSSTSQTAGEGVYVFAERTAERRRRAL